MKLYLLAFWGVLLPQTLLAQPTGGELEFDNKYTLRVPFISFEGEPGKYLNAVLKSEDSELSWTLLSVDEGELINTVASADVVKTSELPVQVFLKVSGWISSCVEVGEYAITKDQNDFGIFLYVDPDSLPSPGVSCTADSVAFSKTIPLPVFGLEAGDFSFSVNNKINGSFSLEVVNQLP